MKISLDIHKQSAALSAFGALDGYDQIVPPTAKDADAKVIRVPFKLGTSRRELVKNIGALKASLQSFEEARIGLLGEIYPDKPEYLTTGVPESDPGFADFKVQMQALLERKDDIELLPMPAAVMYGNDFPSAAVALLDELKLISEAP